MTKTAFLIHSSVASGAELALVRALEAWPAHDEAVVFLGAPGEISSRLEAIGVDCHVVESTKAGSTGVRRGSRIRARVRAGIDLVRYGAGLRQPLRSVAPDVVVARSLRAAIYGRVATAGLGIPFVWSVHDLLTPAYLGRQASWVFGRLLPRLTDAIIVNSEATRATVHSGRRPVLVVPPSLGFDERDREPRLDGVQRVVLLGRLAEWKGQDVGLRAFAAIQATHDAELWIVGEALFGEDAYRDSLQSTIEDLDLGHRVRMLGHQEDPRGLLLGADVLLHSSRLPEPFGAVVIEGLAAGCVVVACKPGGPAETIEHGVTGWLARADDVDDLAAKLETALTMEPAARRAMQEAGAARARSYEAEILSPRMARWLGRVADGSARGVTRAVDNGSRP
ncbi:glycosyltransferase family 4 protein [Nocardioides plantarum]|uniref:Glycosyltransferase family 4 protein n=1 Tax=Nocardioides plantarum TaxID=29299 RepID=A0ABV5K7J4_9ACTN|nr:glycosyltransferase family 4 protein [Nocardioides plantarum]